MSSVCVHVAHKCVCELFEQELFGDVGPLKNARLVKPGVADVIFVNAEDALAAVKTYHMRLLDGKAVYLNYLYCLSLVIVVVTVTAVMSCCS